MNKKLTLVSGSTGGVGSDAAKRLAQHGYPIGCGYYSKHDKAHALVEEIRAAGGRAVAVPFNYESRSSIKEAIATLNQYFDQPVSVLINNGAIAQEKPFHTISDEDWQRMLAINLQGPFIAAQEVLPQMQAQKWGRIINITSIGGQWGGYNQVHYAASKAALINFTQSLSKIYARENVHAFAVAIGLVETQMSKNELNTKAGQDKVANIPAQRLANTAEISETLAFLCGDHATYLTGQTLSMNGGMYFG